MIRMSGSGGDGDGGRATFPVPTESIRPSPLPRPDEADGGAPLSPRAYQVELLAAAIRSNLLICLPTGAGKTWIGAALLHHFVREENAAVGGGCRRGGAASTDEGASNRGGGSGGGSNGGGGAEGGGYPTSPRLGLFLVPTVPLVAQQSKLLRAYTGLRVGTYCGSQRVDMWSVERWAAETAVREVFVATPQTILDALRHGLLRMEDFTAIVFDECHHVSGNDIYAQLLREFYAVWDTDVQGAVKPRILGLTASPLKRVADSTHTLSRCTAALANVEWTFDAPLRTLSPDSAAAVAAITVIPQEATALYTPSRLLLAMATNDSPDGGAGCNRRGAELDEAEDLLDGIGAFDQDHGTGQSPHRDRARDTTAYRSAASRKTEYVVAVLGRRAGELWAAHLGVPDVADAYADDPPLSDKASVLSDALVSSFNRLTGVVAGGTAATAAAAAVARPSPGGLVFVARRVTAWALSALLTAVVTPSDARIRVGYVVGRRSGATGVGGAIPTSWTAQRETLANLHAGTLTVIVCTNVLAEGLDVPHVATVLLSDGAASPSTYVQARGRARDARAKLVWLLPRGDPPTLDGLPGGTVAASMTLARRGAAMMELALDSRTGGAVGRGEEAEAAPVIHPTGYLGGSGSRSNRDGDGTSQIRGWGCTSDLGFAPPSREPIPTFYSKTTRARVNTHSGELSWRETAVGEAFCCQFMCLSTHTPACLFIEPTVPSFFALSLTLLGVLLLSPRMCCLLLTLMATIRVPSPPPPPPTHGLASALGLLSRYCTSLLTVEAARLGAKAPKFTTSTRSLAPHGGPPFEAIITLPATSPVEHGTCARASTAADAKRCAALDACTRLYAAGELDAWLLPRDAHLDGLLKWHRG